MAYYNKCPDCLANLDPGEKCDCKDRERIKEERRYEARMLARSGGKQMNLRDLQVYTV